MRRTQQPHRRQLWAGVAGLYVASLCTAPISVRAQVPVDVTPTTLAQDPTPEPPADPPAEPTSETTADPPPSELPSPVAEPDPEPTTPALPADATRLAILPIVLSGAEDSSTAQWIDQHLRRGLARGAFAIVEAEAISRVAPDGCQTAACFATVGTATRATFALRAQITVNDRDYNIRLDLYATSDGAVVASSEERCDLCGRAEVTRLVEAQAALLRTKLEDLIQGPPVLVVTSVPAGALVYVDDDLVGQTPLERKQLPGVHVIRVVLDNYIAENRQVELSTGVRQSLNLELRREPRAARRQALGWASIGVGLPTIATGLALLAINRQPIRHDCSEADGNRDASGNCRFIYRTYWGGASALAAGAALVSIGITLLLVHRKPKAKPNRRAHWQPTGTGVQLRF